MSRFCPLFSSSKGNCAYLAGGGTSLLVDAGVSLRQLTAALREQGTSPEELGGVLITHEHSDHIRGLSMLLKKHQLPLYASPGTLEAIREGGHLPPGAKVIELTGPAVIGGIEVTPFDTPHDARQSTGFRFLMPDQRSIAVATDLGCLTEEVRVHITGCDLVMLESNYDRGMLDCSSYPYYLKRRIRSELGHLSNELCAQECARLIENGTTRLILAHLSEQNNLPALARQATQALLDRMQMRAGTDYILGVAPARGATQAMIF